MDQTRTGALIRALRQQKHLTQRQLADAVGVSDKPSPSGSAAAARLPYFAHGTLLWYCTRHGLFAQKIDTHKK